MKTITFQHPYYKLKNQIFPTTRGKSWITKVLPDTTIRIVEEYKPIKQRESFGIILSIDLKRIDDLSLAFLSVDGGYSNITMSNHYDFIRLLNSFRRFQKIESGSEYVTVLWILRTGEL